MQSVALVTAMAVNSEGRREILGIAVGAAETEELWKSFLRELLERGLHGVQLVISDAHCGLDNAIAQVLIGTTWQRCRVHFMRNVRQHVPRSAEKEVSDQVRSVFEQPSHHHARGQLQRVVDDLTTPYPKVAELLEAAGEDILAHMHFPKSHWVRIRSTNPLERLNREIKRRFNVVGIFPNRPAVIRLGGAALLEQHEEWMTGRRYFGEESISTVLDPTGHQPGTRAADD